MTDFIDEVFETYKRILPSERQWARFRMSQGTLLELRKRNQRPMYPPKFCPTDNEECFKESDMPAQLFGIPIDVDNSIPLWTVVPDVETPQERRMKEFAMEASKRGRPVTINVMRPAEWLAAPKAPDPTFKALVKHWWKRFRKQ